MKSQGHRFILQPPSLPVIIAIWNTFLATLAKVLNVRATFKPKRFAAKQFLVARNDPSDFIQNGCQNDHVFDGRRREPPVQSIESGWGAMSCAAHTKNGNNSEIGIVFVFNIFRDLAPKKRLPQKKNTGKAPRLSKSFVAQFAVKLLSKHQGMVSWTIFRS